MNIISQEQILSDSTHWRFWGRWKMSLFTNAPYNWYASIPLFKQLNIPREFRGWALNVDGYVYSLEADHRIFDRFITDAFENNLEWFDAFFSICENNLVRADALRKNNDVIACMEVFSDIACTTMVIHFSDKGLEGIVPDFAQKTGLSSDQFARVLVPYKPTYTMQYKEALKKVTESTIDQFVKEYEWVGAGYLGGKRLTKDEVVREQEKELHHEESTIMSVDLSSLDSKVRKQIEVLQKLIYYRSANAEVVNKVLNRQWEALDQLAAHYGLTRKHIEKLTSKEVVELAEKGKLPVDFPNRSVDYGIGYVHNTFRVFYGDELKSMITVFEQKSVDGEKVVSGRAAFKGKARGTVKIVENTSDLEKVQVGDIIISPETMPEYVVGMKKAAAFVTNMGGITSHAAIVARELKKPCIVGTKNATNIFKDGDMVEVDADEGIVRVV